MNIFFRFTKKLSLLLVMAMCLSNAEAARTTKNNKVGLGFSLGAPSGLNAKIWLSHYNALDITVGWSYWNFWTQVNYLWHNWSVIRETQDLKIPLYYGVGGFAGGVEHKTGIGPDAVIGLEFLLKKAPFGFFLEAGPAIQLVESTGIFMHAALGARFYFPN